MKNIKCPPFSHVLLPSLLSFSIEELKELSELKESSEENTISF